MVCGCQNQFASVFGRGYSSAPRATPPRFCPLFIALWQGAERTNKGAAGVRPVTTTGHKNGATRALLLQQTGEIGAYSVSSCVFHCREYFRAVILLPVCRSSSGSSSSTVSGILPMKLFLVLTLLGACSLNVWGAQSKFARVLGKLTPQKSTSGLLIGVRNDDGYQTVLIGFDGKKAEVAANLPLLATPQGETFAYMYKRSHDSVSLIHNDASDNEIVRYREHWEELITSNDRRKAEHEAELAFNEEQKRAVQCDTCQAWEWEDYLDVAYVVPGHITLSVYGGGYTGGAHPNAYNDMFTVRFASVVPRVFNYMNDESGRENAYIPSELSELYPVEQNPGIAAQIRRELLIKGKLEYFIDNLDNESAYEGYDSTEYAGIDPAEIDGRPESVDTSAVDFVLQRVRGTVHLKCQADAQAAYAESGDYVLTAEVDCGTVPQPYVSQNTFTLDYDDFTIADSTVRDVFISPAQDMVYVLADDTLIGIDVATKNEVIHYALPEGSIVVMAEWATGDRLGKWTAALR